jgi:hypothetical protein
MKLLGAVPVCQSKCVALILGIRDHAEGALPAPQHGS